MKRMLRLLACLTALALVLAACGDGDDETTTTAAGGGDTTMADTTMADTTMADTTETTEGDDMASGDAVTVCQVTDVGGIDDKSFNETAWSGVQQAIDEGLATEDSSFLESTSGTDYAPNLQSFVDQDCGLIVSVGFLLETDTAAVAEANPEETFMILDTAPSAELDNYQGVTFDTTGAAFLAGYMAAGVTETGVVATYGGLQLPCSVTCFMDGFVYGVRHYNEVNGTDVQTLGWNPEDQTGVFTETFEDLNAGRTTAQSLIDEGADVILPVAGPVGEGSAALAQELGNVWIVGVDADWRETVPQYADQILTSVLKGLDVAVVDTVRTVVEGTFEGGTRDFGIEEEGVGIGSVHDSVDSELVSEVEALRDELVSGSIVPGE